MNICPNCGTGFQDDEEFCLDCGLKLTLDLQGQPVSSSVGRPGIVASSADGAGSAPAGGSAATLPTAGKKPPGRRSGRKPADATTAASDVRRGAAVSDSGTDRLMRYRPVYKAPDEWTAVTIKDLLCSAGLTAQVLPILEPFEDGIDRMIEGYWGKVLVLESDLEEACRLIGDYLRGLDRSMH